MRREASLGLILLTLTLTVPAHAGSQPPPACADAAVQAVSLAMPDGSTATGCVGVPAGGIGADVDTVIVFAHGHGQSAATWNVHMAHYAALGYPSITMDYRGAWDEFPLQAGAEDTIAAAQHLRAIYPAATRTVVFGVSMGGAVSGMAIAQAPAGTFDHWFMVEGLSVLTETWAEATAVEPATAAEIERECGGTPNEVPQAYIDRSAALLVPQMVANGLASAVVVHPLNDGRVPIDQGYQTLAALTAGGVPTEFYQVLRGDPDELGTTGTGALGLGGTDPVHNLAGHGWEGSTTHIVMRTALDRLDGLLAGNDIGAGAFVVDEGIGQVPA